MFGGSSSDSFLPLLGKTPWHKSPSTPGSPLGNITGVSSSAVPHAHLLSHSLVTALIPQSLPVLSGHDTPTSIVHTRLAITSATKYSKLAGVTQKAIISQGPLSNE